MAKFTSRPPKVGLPSRLAYGLRRRLLGSRHVNFYYSTIGKIRRRGDINVRFFPRPPAGMNYTIEKVLCELGIPAVEAENSTTRLGMVWDDSTISPRFEASYPVLNNDCTDISKQHVERVFEQVFRYPLRIDPATHQGLAVCKSDLNGQHDGKLIQCPIAATDPAKVYEVAIDNSIDDRMLEDIRVAVIGRALPYVTLKRRWKQQQFHNVDITAHVVDVDEALSPGEQAKVLELARAIGLDYGEMDGLRDRSTGKFYVVDINKTPFGPASRMSFFPKRRAVKRLAEVFEAEFLS